MAADPLNSRKFADSIIRNTLSTLRDQEDDKQEQQFRGSITFNLAVFQSPLPSDLRFAKRKDIERKYPTDKNFLVLGPYKFTRRFAQPPQMFWGQQTTQTKDGALAQPKVGIATNYSPFLLLPSCWQYTYINGEVDGFFVGLYAITRPPKGTITYTVDWLAVGSASRYSEQGQKESWVNPYDHNHAAYLQQGT